jgi:hypothetical protein
VANHESGWQEVCGGVVFEIRGFLYLLGFFAAGVGDGMEGSVGGGVGMRLENGEYQTQTSSDGIEQCFG